MNASVRPFQPHILLALSSHGFGHLSQAAPVVNHLRTLIPDLFITVRGNFPAEQIQERIFNPNVLVRVADDLGMVMNDALTVDLMASLEIYHQFHHSWSEKVDQLSRELVEQNVTLVLSDIPYLTLAAAQKAGIPCVALCSINWADILEYFLTQTATDDAVHHMIPYDLFKSSQKIVHEIRSIYHAANHFLLPAPSMPMNSLTNTLAIDLICTLGTNRRSALSNSIRSIDDCWLVLVGMGGMPFSLNLDAWPTYMSGKRIHYLAAKHVAQRSSRPHVTADTLTNLSYSDLIASVDLIITKPGYGMFAEASAAGVPVLYVERESWPETQALTNWLHTVAHCAEISTAELHSGTFKEKMQTLLQRGRYTPVEPAGNMQAATLLSQYLRSTEQTYRE